MINKTSDSKLWASIAAVASGIITNLLYDLVSHTSYILLRQNSQYMIIPDNNNTKNTVFSIIIIILLFLFLWFSLIGIIQGLARIHRQFNFRKLEPLSQNKAVYVINTAKEQTFILLKTLYTNQNQEIVSFENLAKLQCKNLADIIITLHRTFSPGSYNKTQHIKDYFRRTSHSSIINSITGISKYELCALIEILRKIVNEISPKLDVDNLLKKDCDEMLKMLEDLQTVTDSIN